MDIDHMVPLAEAWDSGASAWTAQRRETVSKLKETVARQKAEIEELRQLVTRLTLASAVLTHERDRHAGPDPVSDNAVPLPRPTT